MFVKACIAGALALALSNPAEQAPIGTTTSFVTNPYIKLIRCIMIEDGEIHKISGSGFKMADGRWVSVNHVTSNLDCNIDGKPITVTYADPWGDFSTFTVDIDLPGGLKPDCTGYHDSQWVHGQGYAGGLPIITSVAVMGSDVMAWMGKDRGWSVLIYSRFIPGQSGGAVLNSAGDVVGTVNAFNPFLPISYSRALRETPICQS